ncbi:MAG TPA: type 4a pilus biogenesis protein PilO [Verrucomicrobiae bacterium]
MKIKNRQDFLVVLAISAVALYVAVTFVFTPLGGWWSARSTKIKDLRTQVSDGKLMIAREASLRSNWNSKLKNALPNNTAVAQQQVIKAFAAWANDSGTELNTINPQWKNDATNYMTLNCHVEASGTLRTLSQFIYDVEKGQMALRLDSVELSAHDTTGQQLTLGMDVNGLALLEQDKK